MFLGAEYARRGWVQQYHIGALRNNNLRQFKLLGPDVGFDSINDRPMAEELSAAEQAERRKPAAENHSLLPEPAR